MDMNFKFTKVVLCAFKASAQGLFRSYGVDVLSIKANLMDFGDGTFCNININNIRIEREFP